MILKSLILAVYTVNILKVLEKNIKKYNKDDFIMTHTLYRYNLSYILFKRNCSLIIIKILNVKIIVTLF